MNYLTIISSIWAICAICAFLFIRGATLRDQLARPVRASTRDPRHAGKALRHTH
jgi:hypothetical protein